MPLPLSKPNQAPQNSLDTAINLALQKTGIVQPVAAAAEALENMGLGIPQLAEHLGNLVLSAKDNVKRGAIQDAFALHGVDIKSTESAKQVPALVINVQSESTNINSLLAPNRES